MRTSCRVAVMLLLCLSVLQARKVKGRKHRKELPQPPRWRAGSDPGKDQRFKTESEGQEVKFDCRAKGKPSPQVTWLKDGQVIGESNERVEVKTFRLVIPSLSAQDQGNYSCIVKNAEGQLEWTFYLDVVVAVWPLQMEGPQNSTVMEGETVRFQCRVLNDPGATIRWLKPQSLQSTMYSSYLGGRQQFLDHAGSPGELILTDVTAADAGEYRCLAGNVRGMKHSSAFLTVILMVTTTASTLPTTTTLIITTTTTTTSELSTSMLLTFGPDLYLTTRRPSIGNDNTDKKIPKDKKNRRKNDRRRGKVEKKKKSQTTMMTLSTPGRYLTTTYKAFTQIWSFGDRLNPDSNQVSFEEEPRLSDDEDTDGNDSDEDTDRSVSDEDSKTAASDSLDRISLWTIYTIVGAMAGIILLIGLLAISIAVCCRRDNGPVYKSTPV